jgi:4-hydroxybenzoate polyprenyltransferase
LQTQVISIKGRLIHYAYMMRLDKPIGILLLLWPTLWALWLASGGIPEEKILWIFLAGVVLMRSAGCVFNDIADRKVDSKVKRTRERPLATGKVSVAEALFIGLLLCGIAFLLVLQCNTYTILLSFIGIGLAIAYPLLKRITHLPQVGLGAAFTWGVPMAFAAVRNDIPTSAVALFLTGLLWPVIYDTLYAMVDRDDDRRIGVKSTAILFAQMDTVIIALLQTVFILMMIAVGIMFRLHRIYYLSLIIAACLFMYQQWMIRHREPSRCFAAFLNNNWVGCVIFAGIALSYAQ